MNPATATNIRTARIETVGLAGEAAVCDPRGVLWLPDHSLLVVSDLHLEKGSSLARRGILLPPYDTAATIARLQTAILDYSPRIVVSLGDSFHDGEGPLRLPQIYRDALSALALRRDWLWVSGNHDPDGARGLDGDSVLEVAMGPLVFRHLPSPGQVPGEVAGHLHPCARIVQRGRSVRRRCFGSDGERMIMPAFGSFTGSLNLLDVAFATLFRRERLTAYMLGADRTFAISGSRLRPG